MNWNGTLPSIQITNGVATYQPMAIQSYVPVYQTSGYGNTQTVPYGYPSNQMVPQYTNGWNTQQQNWNDYQGGGYSQNSQNGLLQLENSYRDTGTVTHGLSPCGSVTYTSYQVQRSTRSNIRYTNY